MDRISKKFIIAGGRDFNNYELLRERCDFFLKDIDTNMYNVVVISGDNPKGVDRLAIQYAQERGYELEKYPARWKQFGSGACYKRNNYMSKLADGLICFWDGKSHGSKHMIKTAKQRGLMIRVVGYRMA